MGLLYALVDRKPLELIQSFVEPDPQGAIDKKVSGGQSGGPCRFQKHPWVFACLPVHAACFYHPDLKVIQYLVDKYGPEEIRAVDLQGSTLLHTLCRSSVQSISQDVFKYVLDLYPESVKTRDRHGVFPFYFCANSVQEVPILQMLLDANPSAIRNKDNTYWGQLPLHWAVSRSRDRVPAAEKVDFLVNSYPEALHVRDKNGMTPLELAISENMPTEIIELLTRVDLPQAQNMSRTCQIGVLLLIVGFLLTWRFRMNNHARGGRAHHSRRD